MRKILPILAMFFGLILILAGIGVFVIEPKLQNPGTIILPDLLADQPLGFRQEGWRATAEFGRLHQQDFPMTAGAVGYYGANSEATLWVGETFLKLMAGKMVADMHAKLALGNSPFTPTGEIQQNGRTIYALDGMGQKHFYYQSDKLIVWLAANESIADQAIEEILEVYP